MTTGGCVPRSCQPETCETLHPCSKCKIPQSCTEYYRRKNVTPAGRDRRGERTTVCKTCATASRVQWVKDNPARTREYMMSWKFGITVEQFDSMLESQGGRCAICQAAEPGGKGRWHIDHDHACCDGDRSCGECVRGLLCHGCNTALGLLGDNINSMRRAIAYVQREL